MVTTRDLGDEALEYIRSELSDGRGLGSRLVQHPLDGSLIAILPASVPADAALDFQSGDVARGQEVTKLADLVWTYVSERTVGVCVFEHATLRAGDPHFPALDYFTVGADVYLILTGSSDLESIAAAAKETHWYPSIGVLSTLSDRQIVPASGSSQPEAVLDELAARVEGVIVGAYDGESWIVWLSSRLEGDVAHRMMGRTSDD